MARTTISKDFRDLLLAELPGLAKNPAYWAILGWEMFGRLTDYNGVLVSQEVLARLEGKQHQLKSRNYSGITFLEAFKQDVAPEMEWSEFNRVEGKAREIVTLGLPDTVLEALREEQATPVRNLNQRVYLDTGNLWTPSRQKQHREEDRGAAMMLLDKAGCVEAQRLMEYLNTLAPNRFTAMLDGLGDAYSAAMRLESQRSREQALRLLRNIADQPQPLYGPTGNGRTVRLFSTNESLCRLPRSVRKVLTRNWTSVDLKSAQLAIVGRLWNVPLIDALLRSGASVWEYFCEELGVLFTEEHKKGIKQMTYALVFGSSAQKGKALDQAARTYFPNQADIVTRFFAVPVIAALYDHREAAREAVVMAGGAYDAFGNWIALPMDEYGKPNARSVLASQAQSGTVK